MQNWRWWLLALLSAFPFLFLMAYGAVALWHSGYFAYVWWPLTGCFALALFLAWRWQRKRRLLNVDFSPSLHWTDQDRQAWELVEKRAQNAAAISMDQLTNLNFYVDTARDLASDLAHFYHPGAQDPIANLTLLEILGAVELAAHDLALLMEKYVPGSHFLSIKNWKTANQALGWYQTLSNVGWIIAGVFNPIGAGARYLGTQLGVNRPWAKLQENLQAWFYAAFIQRLGSYFIELYGGRLRAGATRYRQLFGTPTIGPPEEQPDRPLAIVVLGQAKTGKSSLVNALLGERKADTDVVQATDEQTRYDVHPPGLDTRLTILDTVGYGAQGPRADQLRATETAAREADAILLVLHARNPARQADLELLQKLANFFQENPTLKKPPILGVLTHIDLLSPSLEWQPPYDWTKAARPKEKNIAAAIQAAEEQLGDYLMGIAPVCTAEDKIFGIQEALIPTLASVLEEARAVALVRCLKAESDTGTAKKMFGQLLAAGSELLGAWWKTRK
ncbi:MAG: GTPase [Gemmataceae bacterium]